MFTFKTEHPTGRYRSFYPSHHYVKLKKEVVGMISDAEPHKIRLMVEDESGNKNCGWKWITLKKESSSVLEAKEFLNKYFEEIISKYKLFTEKQNNEKGKENP